MKTRLYIKPEIKVISMVVDSLMEVISLPTTGHVDNPSFGQAKGYNDFIDDEDSIVFESKPCVIYNAWEERKPNLIYDAWSEGKD
jgi:hypothetical protein